MIKSAIAKRRGVVLLTTLFFMILFAMLSFALYQLSPNDSRTALRERTLAEAHFACTAGIRNVKEWISAVTKPSSDSSKAEYLGEGFTGHTVSAMTPSYAALHNDPFSVPSGDPNFEVTTVSQLKGPYNSFRDNLGIQLTGPDFLGLQSNVNVRDFDYTGLKALQGNWIALRTPGNSGASSLKLGEYEVFTYVVPSGNTRGQLIGASPPGLRTYLITSIAYRNQLPVMRARCVMKEISAADYAYRANVGARDVMNNPVTWNVADRNSVLFDGPVHTNEVPYISAPLSYWNDPLAFISLGVGTVPSVPKRAFMGSLTFSGTDTTSINSTLAFDGVGWFQGNYNSPQSDDRRPFDSAGNPIPSTAWNSAANPVLDTGPILNRYDRVIAGGRPSISKVATVPLPADNNEVKIGAYGSTADTGLAANAVDNTQQVGSLQDPSVPARSYRNASGTVVNISAKTNTSNFGIFVNPKSGSTEAAGGVVIQGDTRTMTLEVTDSNGRVITNDAALQSGTAVGNPTTRIQATVTSYDSNSGTPQADYVAGATVAVPGSTVATVPAVPAYTTPTVPAVPAVTTPTVPTVPAGVVATVPTVPASTGGPMHGIPGCPSPNVTYSTVGGSSIPTYNCPHLTPIPAVPAVPASTSATVPAVPAVPGTTTATVAMATVATVATVPAVGATTSYSTPWVASGNVVLDPFQYKAQDWVVDVKNTSTTLLPSMPMPTSTPERDAWQYGVGSRINSSNSHADAKPTDLMGNTPASYVGSTLVTDASQKGITQVVKHIGYSDTTGTPVTSAETIGVGKVLVYKQSRSDANRVDVFVLDRPSTIPTSAQPGALNGGVFSTGNIHALRGVNMDPKTIGAAYGTNSATEKGINIIDNLWQFGTTRGNKPTNANHGLGLVAPKMNVQTREDRFTGSSLYIYATMIAGSASQNGGSWSYRGLDVSRANNSNTTDFNRVATTTDGSAASRMLQIFGGLTEQQTRARLNGSRGWGQQMTFDKELSLKPPPFFPSSNLLVPMAYSQESVLGR